MAHPVDRLDTLDQQLIADQVKTYQQLQTQLLSAQSTSGQKQDSTLQQDIDSLCVTLLEANQLVLANFHCQLASSCFLKAFRIDPHNPNLYQLSQLMNQLHHIARSEPDAWEVECTRLASAPENQFKAAQYYLAKAKTRITDTVQETLSLVQMGLLDTPRDTLREIITGWPETPRSIQVLQYICNAYWHLYDYDDQKHSIDVRLSRARADLEAAQASYGNQTPSPSLSAELTILATLLKTYQFLSQTENQNFDEIKTDLADLPSQTNHAFIKRLERELASLDNWKNDYEKVLNFCLKYQYGQALSFIEERLQQNQEAYQWLASALTPDVNVWYAFCKNAETGAEAWRNHQYQQAEQAFGQALAHMPIYTNGLVPAPLKQELHLVVQALETLQTSIKGNLSLLLEADYFEVIERIPGNLRKVQALEEKYQPVFAGESFITSAAERADQFTKQVYEGNLPAIYQLIDEAKAANDPLVSGYARVARVIDWGTNTDHLKQALSQVDTALQLAPNSRTLIAHKQEVAALLKAVTQILSLLKEADFVQVWQILDKWENSHQTLPESLECLWQVCAGYDHLLGKASEGLTSVERLETCTRFTRQANQLNQDIDLDKLSAELHILQTLVAAYQTLQQEGIVALPAVIARIEALQDSEAEDAEAVSPTTLLLFEQKLVALAQWQKTYESIVEDLAVFRYDHAFERIQLISSDEQNVLHWLNDAVLPDWAGWAHFFQEVRSGQWLALARNYKQARTQVLLAARKVPADATFGSPNKFSESLNNLVRNLVLLEARINDSRALLINATEPNVYDRALEKLEEAMVVEDQFFPEVAQDNLTVAAVLRRFYRIIEAAKMGDQPQLERIIVEARAETDPLVEGYQVIKKTIDQGLAPSALPTQIASALKLAPNSDLLATAMDQIQSADLIGNILKEIRAGRLDQAERLLDSDQNNVDPSKQIAGLRQITKGYQALFHPESATLPVAERISQARDCINQAQEGLGSQALQELNVLRTLVVGYNRIHARRWENLDQILKQQPASHGFIIQLKSHLEALAQWRIRRQEILDSWLDKAYLKAWEAFENTSQAEEELVVWLDDQATQSWQNWTEFGYAIWQGFQDWQLFRYKQAKERFEQAQAMPPPDLEVAIQENLIADLANVITDVVQVYRHLQEMGQLLQLLDATYFDQIMQELYTAREIEAKYSGQGKTGVDSASRVLERFNLIKGAILTGNADQMSKLIQDSFVYKEPFGKLYGQMMDMITVARRSGSTSQEVAAGLKIAPESPSLIRRKQQLRYRMNLLAIILSLVALFVVASIIVFFVYLR